MSQDAQTVVRIIPGDSLGDTYGFAGEHRGKYAQANWYKFRDNRYEFVRSANLSNPIAPVDVAVANDGTLITFDNWHNAGVGDVVAIYSPDGKVRKKYRLQDLFPKGVLEKLERTVSSVWWRCPAPDPLVERSNTVEVQDSLGGTFIFRLATGEYAHEGGNGKCKP